MQIALRGLGDAYPLPPVGYPTAPVIPFTSAQQTACDAAKRLDPITPGAVSPCTPDEVLQYIRWRAGADADIARHQAQDAVNPATAISGAVNWISPVEQVRLLSSGRAPLLYWVG